jgi:nicotinamidase-related amidase
VRSLADESFFVLVPHDACAAGSEALHRSELEIMNHIYGQVMATRDVLGYLPRDSRS